MVALYNSESEFLKTPFIGKIVSIKNYSSKVLFDSIPAGEYAIGIIHDLNMNGKLETNCMGIPKEPVAISNNAPSKYGPPKYSDAKFFVFENKKTIQNIEFD